MYERIRYQTGELPDIVRDMKNGIIPCMDVDDTDEFKWTVKELGKLGIYLVEDLPLDRKARDTVKEPEFEFRAPFSSRMAASAELDASELMYIDFYFEPIPDEDYDSILGD